MLFPACRIQHFLQQTKPRPFCPNSRPITGQGLPSLEAGFYASLCICSDKSTTASWPDVSFLSPRELIVLLAAGVNS